MTAPRTGQPARASLGWGALRLQSDERLQELVREGHEQAFDAIVERYRGPLLRYATPLVGPDRAEDVVQQAFEKGLAHLRDDARELQLQAWLYRVTHNTAINTLERKGSDYDQLDENYDGVPQPPDVAARSQRIRDVFKRINRLPERQRSALMLQAVGGKSHEQIANDMRVSPPVVRQLLYRARGSLRDAVGAAVPLPVLRVWLSGAAPDHAHIGEMVAGAGASAGIAKAGVALLATSVIATGAGVEATRHQHSNQKKASTVEAVSPAVDQSALPSGLAGPGDASGRGGAHHRTSGEDRHGRSDHRASDNQGRGGGSSDDSGRGGPGSDDSLGSGSDRGGGPSEGDSGGHHGGGSGPGGSDEDGGSNGGPGDGSEPKLGAEDQPSGGSGGGGSGSGGETDGDSGGGSGGDSGSGSGGHGGGDDPQPDF